MRKELPLAFISLLMIMACTGSEDSLPNPIIQGPVTNTSSDPLSALVESSRYICHARVTKVSSQYEQYDAQASAVMSRVTLDIIKNWKGNLSSGTEIRSFGGIVNGTTYEASDGVSVLFQENEEVVLFLNDFVGGIFPVLGSSGKYLVINNVITSTGNSLDEFRKRINNIIK